MQGEPLFLNQAHNCCLSSGPCKPPPHPSSRKSSRTDPQPTMPSVCGSFLYQDWGFACLLNSRNGAPFSGSPRILRRMPLHTLPRPDKVSVLRQILHSVLFTFTAGCSHFNRKPDFSNIVSDLGLQAGFSSLLPAPGTRLGRLDNQYLFKSKPEPKSQKASSSSS